MTRRIVAHVAVAGLISAACSMLPSPTEAARRPKACAVVYSVARCQAMTDLVAADLGKNRDDVVSVAIVPDAPPEGVHLGAGWHIRLRLALKDGTAYDKLICGGVVHEPACLDDPGIEVRSPISSGYRDVPEGSTPVPTSDPSAQRAASPIVVDAASIPIERLGVHEIVLGEGSMPNGIWTSGTLALADRWPADLALRDGIVRLELRSLEADGRPFDTAYQHGWRAGDERVRAVLLFDVLWFEPGARLEIRNVRVD